MSDRYFGYGPLTGLLGGYGHPWMIQPPAAQDIADVRQATALNRALHAEGRRERYRLYLCNRHGVRLAELGMVSGRIDMRADADVPTSMQCEIVADDSLWDVQWPSMRLQAVMEIELETGEWAECPLGLFLPATPGFSASAAGDTLRIDGYDLTLILREDRITSPLVIPKGTRYADAILGQIHQAGVYTVILDDMEGALSDDVAFDMGASRLEIVNSLLRAVNFQKLYASGAGVLIGRRALLPYERQVDHVYMDDELSVLTPRLGTEMDTFDVPNVVVGVVSRSDSAPLVATWENHDPASPLSIEARGRRVVRIDQLEDTLDEAALTAYVRMEGYKARAVMGQATFSTAVMPGHGVGDVLFLRIFAQRALGASGRYQEVGYSMELRPGAEMTHTAERAVIIR